MNTKKQHAKKQHAKNNAKKLVQRIAGHMLQAAKGLRTKISRLQLQKAAGCMLASGNKTKK